MMAFIDWLLEIPAVCFLGLCYAVAFLLLLLGQWIDHKHDIKKHGKDYADEIARRW